MDFGIPVEISTAERRVALTPAGVHRLVRAGHRVYVQRSAGKAAWFTDQQYLEVGAQLAYDAEEVFGRADLVLKVGAPVASEYPLLRQDQILMCFLVPVVTPAEGFRTLLARGVAAVAMELIEDDSGNAPVLQAISEIAGPLAIHTSAHLLESTNGGRGILLGGGPGIPPANVVILGAGVLGTAAGRTAIGLGAHVLVLDRDLRRLRAIDERFERRAATAIADEYNLERAVQFADVLVGAVLIRAGRTPHLVTEAMVRKMKPGSVILDLSIDQGGCIETSRPTTLVQPTFVQHGVIHYAVPNVTAMVARTATYALTNACLPYALAIAEHGLKAACAVDRGLATGLITAEGRCYHPAIAEQFGVPCATLDARSGVGVFE